MTPTNRSHLAAIVSTAVIAYAAADVVHEVCGHALAAALVGVPILTISSVAVETAVANRLVAAAGTSADVVAAGIAFAILSRRKRFGAGRYCLWLFAAVNAMNGGYMVYSGLFDNGDWAVVIADLNPSWAWRLGTAAAGAVAYAIAIRIAARSAAWWVRAGDVSLDDLSRLTLTSYVAGGLLLVLASALNPFDVRLVLISGVGASFALTWGLLRVPGIVASLTTERPEGAAPLRFERSWALAAIVGGAAFVGVLGPGNRLSRSPAAAAGIQSGGRSGVRPMHVIATRTSRSWPARGEPVP